MANIADTIRDIAAYSKMTVAETYSLRLIGKQVRNQIIAARRVLKVFNEWDVEQEIENSDAAKARNVKVTAYRQLKEAIED
ncbi:MAG TPA: hypothetical protein VMW16_00100 [Sedimentisphaerales bacterium]|nr:hypothetical protein [Sedimentisphaerales bacterium]